MNDSSSFCHEEVTLYFQKCKKIILNIVIFDFQVTEVYANAVTQFLLSLRDNENNLTIPKDNDIIREALVAQNGSIVWKKVDDKDDGLGKSSFPAWFLPSRRPL